ERAGHEFDERITFARFQVVERLRDEGRKRRLRRCHHLFDQRAETHRLRFSLRWPYEGDRFREIADIVVRKIEKNRIDAVENEATQQRRLGVSKRQRAGERGKGVAAIRILGAREVISEQADLQIALRLKGKPVEKPRKGLHAAPSSPSSSS